MKKILFVGSECMPFAATGGLGDVMGSLPAALKKAGGSGIDARVVMPLYDRIGNDWRSRMQCEAVFEVYLGWRRQYCGVHSLEKDGVKYYFIDNEYYFKRGALYGQYDDGERFAFFSMAVLEMLWRVNFLPDIIHANDWQSALSVVYYNLFYKLRRGYHNIKTVFTIHNIEYQGQYSMEILKDVFGIDWREVTLMEYGGCINLMKAAIKCADRVTTVSPRYAGEIQSSEYAHGLEAVLREENHKLCGILNGIDYVYYDPENDPEIAAPYSAADVSGKAEDKAALLKELSLTHGDAPVFSIISRLVSHKGTDLVRDIAYKMMYEQNANLIILGTGEGQYEEFFRELERNFPDKVRALICYDRALSKRIYAGSDYFIMPSKSEPCGLSQMIASRYGAIPIVRETGGLYDSIKGYWVCDGEVRGNGFTFANYSSYELYDRICAAMSLYADKEAFAALRRKVMEEDFSWDVSARAYMNLYEHI